MHTRQGVAVPAQTQSNASPEPTTLTLQIIDTQAVMYARESNQQGQTIHSKRCEAAFGRRDWRCHRCCELMLDASPRKGWQQEYFRRKLGQLQRRLF